LRERLTNIRPAQLQSYNKVRKVVDLYLEQLVALASELNQFRTTLVPLLRVPLDTWIFSQQCLFDDQDLRNAGVRRNSGFGALTTEDNYRALQQRLSFRADACSQHHGDVDFHPIYFDLLWGNRYTRGGGNLFELNP
jgi:hypothetical protein